MLLIDQIFLISITVFIPSIIISRLKEYNNYWLDLTVFISGAIVFVCYFVRNVF